MPISVITAPASEPVTLAELKQFARVDHSDDDDEIESLGVAAREFVEIATGRALETRTLELVLDGFPVDGIVLPRPPLQSVTSVKYRDRADVEQTLVAETDYRVDTASGLVETVTSWPATAERSDAVRVRFVAGYPDTADSPPVSTVPRTLMTAIKSLVAFWYDTREPATVEGARRLPLHVRAMLNQMQDRRA